MYNKLTKSKKMFFWVVLTAVYMVVLLGLSVKSSFDMEVSSFIFNLFHVPAYVLLAFLLVNTLYVYNKKISFRLWAFWGAVFYGGLMEVAQSFVPGRTASLGDLILDAIGAGGLILVIKKTGCYFQESERRA